MLNNGALGSGIPPLPWEIFEEPAQAFKDEVRLVQVGNKKYLFIITLNMNVLALGSIHILLKHIFGPLCTRLPPCTNYLSIFIKKSKQKLFFFQVSSPFAP